MTTKLSMDNLREFADALVKDPAMLFNPEYEFMLQALSQYGDLKMPSAKNNNAPTAEKAASAAVPPAAEATGVEVTEDSDEEPEEVDSEIIPDDPPPFLAVPSGGEDWDGAVAAKEKAADAKANGDFDTAIKQYTEAMSLGQVSAMILANRADCLLKLKRPRAAIADCDAALGMNPDSAKALRTRGKAYRFVGMWTEATLDLAAAQRIDFDEGVEELLKTAKSHLAKIQAKEARKRNKEEEKQRKLFLKRKAEIEAARKAQAEAAANDSDDDMPDLEEEVPGGRGQGAMPDMAGGAGAGGMQQMLMQLLMGDPELAAGMQNPKIMKAFSAVMSGGGPGSPAMAEAMKDPEVKTFMDKVSKKLGPLMGAMGGGGMPGMGGPMGGGGMPGMGGPMGGGGMPHFEDEVD